MTGKILLLSAICLSALTVKANDVITTSDSISKQVSVTSEHYLQTLKPTYLTNVSEAANWGRNWFIEVKGGRLELESGSHPQSVDVWLIRDSPSRMESLSRWTTISFMLTFSTTLPLASTVMTSVCPDGTLYLSLV